MLVLFLVTPFLLFVLGQLDTHDFAFPLAVVVDLDRLFDRALVGAAQRDMAKPARNG